MARYDIPVQENGRMVLPAALRRALGVEKGDRVVVQAEGDRIEITTAARSRARARARMRTLYEGRTGVTDEVIAERREEARREGDGPEDKAGGGDGDGR